MKKLKEHFLTALPALIYMIIYLVWFGLLEASTNRDYSIIHLKMDDKIPFCEYFIIPYLIWFFYVGWCIIYLFFKDKKGYRQCCTFLFSGMTVFLIVSTIFPSIQYLRPSVMPRDNVFSELVRYLYQIDTNTNIWPSIHVYNSIGVFIAVSQSEIFKNRNFTKAVCFLLSSSIILSTVFLKQHSMFDVMTAFIMAAFFYTLTYRMDILTSVKRAYLSFQEKEREPKHIFNK